MTQYVSSIMFRCHHQVGTSAEEEAESCGGLWVLNPDTDRPALPEPTSESPEPQQEPEEEGLKVKRQTGVTRSNSKLGTEPRSSQTPCVAGLPVGAPSRQGSLLLDHPCSAIRTGYV